MQEIRLEQQCLKCSKNPTVFFFACLQRYAPFRCRGFDFTFGRELQLREIQSAVGLAVRPFSLPCGDAPRSRNGCLNCLCTILMNLAVQIVHTLSGAQYTFCCAHWYHIEGVQCLYIGWCTLFFHWVAHIVLHWVVHIDGVLCLCIGWCILFLHFVMHLVLSVHMVHSFDGAHCLFIWLCTLSIHEAVQIVFFSIHCQ